MKPISKLPKNIIQVDFPSRNNFLAIAVICLLAGLLMFGAIVAINL